MDIELYQIALAAGRCYQVALFFYGFALLARGQLWVLLVSALLGAASASAFYLLAAFGEVPPATPYRLLGVWGQATFTHVLLLVINALVNRRSLDTLKPFSRANHAP